MKATHNISQPVKVEKNGEEKTYWNNFGRLFTGEKDGKKRTVIKIDNIPVNWDGWAYIFPIAEKKNAIEEAKEIETENTSSFKGEEIDLSDIPF